MRFSRAILLICLVFLIQTTTFSQSFEQNYIPIKYNGELPKEFILSAKECIELELDNIKLRGRTKKINKELVVNSNYDIKELFKNGHILFNDTISQYVNSVANIIIKSSPELAGKFHIYVVKSTEVNAYCF